MDRPSTTPVMAAVAEPTPATATPPVVSLQDLRFSYPDGPEVVGGISLSVEAGTTIAFVGPSGCGKSTLLYIIAGLLRAQGGLVDRERHAEPGRHPLTMVFQKDTLFPWCTITENVRAFAMFRQHELRRGRVRQAMQRRGMARRSRREEELDEWVDALLELAHLKDAADAYPYQLSGGMRRRAAFLAGMAPRPHVLLLDEPFSSLDEPTRVGIHQDVYRITRTSQTTTILVTHDLAEAVSLCDRIIVLSDRPARIAQEYEVPFTGERDMLQLRTTPEFLALYGQLWQSLGDQVTKRGAGRGDTSGSID